MIIAYFKQYSISVGQSALSLKLTFSLLSSSSLLFLLSEISFLGGTLRKYVEDEGPVSEKTCAAFGKDLLLAVKFVHEEAGRVHRDIHGSSFPRNHLQLFIGSHS